MYDKAADDDKCTKRGRNTNTLLKQVLANLKMDKQIFIEKQQLVNLNLFLQAFYKLWIKLFIYSLFKTPVYLAD